MVRRRRETTTASAVGQDADVRTTVGRDRRNTNRTITNETAAAAVSGRAGGGGGLPFVLRRSWQKQQLQQLLAAAAAAEGRPRVRVFVCLFAREGGDGRSALRYFITRRPCTVCRRRRVRACLRTDGVYPYAIRRIVLVRIVRVFDDLIIIIII